MSFQPGKHRAESYPEHLDLEADAVVVGSGAGGAPPRALSRKRGPG